MYKNILKNGVNDLISNTKLEQKLLIKAIDDRNCKIIAYKTVTFKYCHTKFSLSQLISGLRFS